MAILNHTCVNIIQLEFTCQKRKIAVLLFSHHYLSERVVLLFEQFAGWNTQQRSFGFTLKMKPASVLLNNNLHNFKRLLLI